MIHKVGALDNNVYRKCPLALNLWFIFKRFFMVFLGSTRSYLELTLGTTGKCSRALLFCFHFLHRNALTRGKLLCPFNEQSSWNWSCPLLKICISPLQQRPKMNSRQLYPWNWLLKLLRKGQLFNGGAGEITYLAITSNLDWLVIVPLVKEVTSLAKSQLLPLVGQRNKRGMDIRKCHNLQSNI